MKSKEVAKALKLLKPFATRVETFGVEIQGGLGLTVAWNDGHTANFHSLKEAEEKASEMYLREISKAVDAADLCCPVEVVDACLRSAMDGKNWKKELAQAIANDAKEAAKLGL